VRVGGERDPDRQPDLHHRIADDDGAFDSRSHPGGELVEPLAPDAWTGDDELVTAEAADDVDASDRPRQPGRHRLEDDVTDGVAVTVVDLLEAVQVGERDHDRVVAIHRHREQPAFEGPAVEHAGQVIDRRSPVEPPVIGRPLEGEGGQAADPLDDRQVVRRGGVGPRRTDDHGGDGTAAAR